MQSGGDSTGRPGAPEQRPARRLREPVDGVQNHGEQDLAAVSLPAEPIATELGGSSLTRALEILGLLSLNSPALRVEDLVMRLGYTQSTAYRYLRELCAAGVLAQRIGGQYSLGPRIIELERLLKLTDPLYLAGRIVLPSTPHEGGMLMLQEIYRDDQVMCIFREGPEELEYEGRKLSIRRARGLPLPLFRGSASLAVLAWLSPYRIKRTYLSSPDEIAQAGLGGSWGQFRSTLTQIRRRGYAISKGLVNPEVIGIGVPILLPEDKRVIGSLAYSLARPGLTPDEEVVLAAQLRTASDAIAHEYVLRASSPSAAASPVYNSAGHPPSQAAKVVRTPSAPGIISATGILKK